MAFITHYTFKCCCKHWVFSIEFSWIDQELVPIAQWRLHRNISTTTTQIQHLTGAPKLQSLDGGPIPNAPAFLSWDVGLKKPRPILLNFLYIWSFCIDNKIGFDAIFYALYKISPKSFYKVTKYQRSAINNIFITFWKQYRIKKMYLKIWYDKLSS